MSPRTNVLEIPPTSSACARLGFTSQRATAVWTYLNTFGQLVIQSLNFLLCVKHLVVLAFKNRADWEEHAPYPKKCATESPTTALQTQTNFSAVSYNPKLVRHSQLQLWFWWLSFQTMRTWSRSQWRWRSYKWTTRKCWAPLSLLTWWCYVKNCWRHHFLRTSTFYQRQYQTYTTKVTTVFCFLEHSFFTIQFWDSERLRPDNDGHPHHRRQHNRFVDDGWVRQLARRWRVLASLRYCHKNHRLHCARFDR